ncbi:MAG: hypothetical protein H0X64_07295, partial [Gemmatimonadaceae bacterium]|nr:hypothetical protein [Gemmatimonadaceae bacterium]
WTGRASFAYDFTFDDGSRRITQVISGDLEVDLVGDSQQLTYTGSPSGSASIAYHEYFYGPNGPALFQTVVGSGPLLPYAPPEGSRVLLHFGAPDCTFNVYVGAYIMATSTYHPYGGPRTGPVNIAKLKSGGVPLPSSGSLAGAGEYPAYSEFYLDRTPPWFSPWGASGAGGAALGSATVSWSFDRVPPATGP